VANSGNDCLRRVIVRGLPNQLLTPPAWRTSVHHDKWTRNKDREKKKKKKKKRKIKSDI
jgi:hypothetical protein